MKLYKINGQKHAMNSYTRSWEIDGFYENREYNLLAYTEWCFFGGVEIKNEFI